MAAPATPSNRRFPLPLPSGWFMLCESEELAAGSVRALRLFDRELVLFRTASGEAALLGAFCPHLGAHLGHGGRVEGEALRCPFHGWAFDRTGGCLEVPYARRIPTGAKAEVWPTREHSGRLWAWHAADSEAPFFEIPEIPEAASVSWETQATRTWEIRSCLQELSENGADSAHFRTVHDMQSVPELGVRFDGAFVRSSTPSSFPAGGRKLDVVIDVHSSGLGCDVIRYSGDLDLVEIVCATPIDADRVRVHMAYRHRKGIGETDRRLAAGIADYLIWQFGKDIPIWENKAYRAKPLLCEGDGPIPDFRRWARRFHPGV